MIHYADIGDAKIAVKEWSENTSSVAHIGDHGSSVFSFKNPRGDLQILRLTDPAFRSLGETLAELNFVNHMHSDRVPVAAAVPSIQGVLAFEMDSPRGRFICSSVAFADGVAVDESSPHWNDTFFREWGRNLALIHESSARFKCSDDSAMRWKWNDEILFRRAEELLPSDDLQSRAELEEIFAECSGLSSSAHEFGLIHGDHAPQNFRYDTENNRITVFDFGNCCYHWFISDLAISLSTVRRKANRNAIKDCILDGYSSIRSLPADHDRQIDLFIRLRVVYFYLSRLHMWSPNPSEQQKKDLLLFRERVHSKIGWNVD